MEEIATKIQAGYKGMLARESFKENIDIQLTNVNV